ncbi:MAG: hypothetical protein CME62_08335 [Halobacteriovoraceae bacterium]|nr:hypothetical protein [Halobacteriovoraceae bacterium]|tara:strand:- start:2762 stop:3601 length:840 start_codon:yes stop_codon:yes gene_type:complete
METTRQLAFINNKYGFTISFINGEQLISEIAQIHNIGPLALAFYKKTLLGSTQLINYLKAEESIGFYIDSEDPYFRYKLELSATGSLRTLLLPEDFEELPTHITGRARIHKMSLKGQPYTSILEYEDFPIESIINDVLDKSYQFQAKVMFSPDFHNSVMITKLPPTNINKKIEDFEEIGLESFIDEKIEFFADLLSGSKQSIAELSEFCEKEDFSYIGSHELKFHCPCSYERMLHNFSTLSPKDIEEIFAESDQVETRCDYCNTIYKVLREDISPNTVQ